MVLNLPLISFVEQNVGDMVPCVHSGPIQGMWGPYKSGTNCDWPNTLVLGKYGQCTLYMVVACRSSLLAACLSPTVHGPTLAFGTCDIDSHQPVTANSNFIHSSHNPFPFRQKRCGKVRSPTTTNPPSYGLAFSRCLGSSTSTELLESNDETGLSRLTQHSSLKT